MYKAICALPMHSSVAHNTQKTEAKLLGDPFYIVRICKYQVVVKFKVADQNGGAALPRGRGVPPLWAARAATAAWVRRFTCASARVRGGAAAVAAPCERGLA